MKIPNSSLKSPLGQFLNKMVIETLTKKAPKLMASNVSPDAIVRNISQLPREFESKALSTMVTVLFDTNEKLVSDPAACACLASLTATLVAVYTLPPLLPSVETAIKDYLYPSLNNDKKQDLNQGISYFQIKIKNVICVLLLITTTLFVYTGVSFAMPNLSTDPNSPIFGLLQHDFWTSESAVISLLFDITTTLCASVYALEAHKNEDTIN